MSSSRKLWPLGLAVVALVALLAAGGWFAFQRQVAQAAASLHQDAVAMAADPLERPAHVAPALAGSFGKCAEPRLDGWVDLLKDEPESCKAYRAPRPPSGPAPGKIPDECLALVTPGNSLAWARGLMSCSRSQTAGLPEGIFTPGHKRYPVAFLPWLQAAKVLAWEVRAQAATGQYAAALETCADVLATGRDLGLGGALVGTMVGAANLKVSFPACAEAVAAADAPARGRFHAALETIRAGTRTNGLMLRDEGVLVGVEHFGFLFDPAQRQSLPKELQERIRPRPAETFDAPLTLAWQLTGLRAMHADVRQVADMPELQRSPLLASLQRKHPVGAGTPSSVLGLEKFLRRNDEAVALLQLLSAAANIDVAAPVTTASFTVQPVEGGVELVPVSGELAKYRVRLAPR